MQELRSKSRHMQALFECRYATYTLVIFTEMPLARVITWRNSISTEQQHMLCSYQKVLHSYITKDLCVQFKHRGHRSWKQRLLYYYNHVSISRSDIYEQTREENHQTFLHSLHFNLKLLIYVTAYSEVTSFSINFWTIPCMTTTIRIKSTSSNNDKG